MVRWLSARVDPEGARRGAAAARRSGRGPVQAGGMAAAAPGRARTVDGVLRGAAGARARPAPRVRGGGRRLRRPPGRDRARGRPRPAAPRRPDRSGDLQPRDDACAGRRRRRPHARHARAARGDARSAALPRAADVAAHEATARTPRGALAGGGPIGGGGQLRAHRRRARAGRGSPANLGGARRPCQRHADRRPRASAARRAEPDARRLSPDAPRRRDRGHRASLGLRRGGGGLARRGRLRHHRGGHRAGGRPTPA